jgi:hypothetical protein
VESNADLYPIIPISSDNPIAVLNPNNKSFLIDMKLPQRISSVAVGNKGLCRLSIY